MQGADTPPLFTAVRREYLRYCQDHPVPPAIHHKLMFLSDCILRLEEADKYELDPHQLQQLKDIDRDSQLRLYVSIARCVMGHHPSDGLRDREAYIRKDSVFSKWEKCLISTTSDGLSVTQKDVTEIPFGELRISSGTKVRNKKQSFLLQVRGKVFLIGCDQEKGAQQIHRIIKQLVMDYNDSRKSNTAGSELGLLQSGLGDSFNSQDLDATAEQIDKPQQEEPEVSSLQDESNFKLEAYLKHGRILRHQFHPNILKCFLLIEVPKDCQPNVCEQILNIFMNFKEWNLEIDRYVIVSRTDGQTYIVYEKYRKSGFMALPRDYVLIKKAAKLSNESYSLVERSAQHRDYPTEYLSVRASMNRRSKFMLRTGSNNKRLVLLVTELETSSNEQDIGVALRYLRSFDKFPGYCQQKLMLEWSDKFFCFEPQKKKTSVRKFMSLQDHIPKVSSATILPSAANSSKSEQQELQSKDQKLREQRLH